MPAPNVVLRKPAGKDDEESLRRGKMTDSSQGSFAILLLRNRHAQDGMVIQGVIPTSCLIYSTVALSLPVATRQARRMTLFPLD
jgi:hypothetical protein